MSDNKVIKTTKGVYPQVYAYILPKTQERKGWVKIGYTERQDVNDRINEQVRILGISYELLWDKDAKFPETDTYFTDRLFHKYLEKNKKVQRDKGLEWFFYDNNPEQSLTDYQDFLGNPHDQVNGNASYQLRDEQAAAVEKTLDYISTHYKGEFLWNAKPRFGKTLTTYDLVRQLDATKVLIVTNRPAIANSWFDDFEKFIAWQTDFAFVSTSDSLKERPVMTRETFLSQTSDGKNRMIAFISLQDLKGAICFGGNYDKLSWVEDMQWDLLVIDEAHEGVDTLKTDFAFDYIDREFTLHLSGTPFKAISSGRFGENEIYNWSYADEQLAKETWDHPELQNPYEKLPRLTMFSYQMSQMVTDNVNKGVQVEGQNIDYAFDLNEFFKTKDSGSFEHEKDIKKWLDSLTRNTKYPFSTKALRDELKHTFWLLDRVASAKALQKLLKNHPVFENYHIVLAAGDGRNEDEPVMTEKSLDRVKKAISKHEKTITLSVGQLTTGVTIPEWTAVLMLSNLKSSSQYMQAAFRAQNPWMYSVDGQAYQKQNAYVFDFAPERTLTIYDEFANNLFSNTSNGHGTSSNRKDNIQHLLNFFPVIAEDSEGEMIELDVNQVLTFPKTIKAQEVVRRGFMSNLLFQNISGVFASTEVQDILDNLNPVDTGKTSPRQTDDPVDTQDVEVDEEGNVQIDSEIAISETQARFGEKVYGQIQSALEDTSADDSKLSKHIEQSFKDNTTQAFKELAKEKNLTAKEAERAVDQSAKAIASAVDMVQKQSDVAQRKAEVEYNKIITQPDFDDSKIAEATATYEIKQKEIADDLKKQVAATVDTKTKELMQETTQAILEKSEDKKKNNVEDDVRARLRGFSCTIPSFLMAYGESDTVLTNFDTHINNGVFKEVTGITLEQFRTLRDKYNFFDEIVFDQSVQEFLIKRHELANYFDNSQDEDIFDYIPLQQTNQIFTPKSVVEMMIDKLEEENPDIFKDPKKTFADLYVKSGLYLTEIVKRLYIGLEDKISDDDARLKHILEHQIYGFAPSEIIYNIARNFIFGFDNKAMMIDSSHIVCLDTTPYAKGDADFEAKCDELFGDKK
ncbi:DEAD/DEAH box helicase family protein [Psychrobacter sp. 4Bb]|uniref:DEAD/DEAH box helicase family protein n=1 Tax=Psychrobacter sp. 4Bb TaxID=888436 RepID=UPI001C60C009|nr:DEAD/DEAH box helicase family protein [Psychrobacter sp. 4Bb]